MAAFFAVMRHETYNRDTARRIRRSLRNRFSQGGIFQCPIYGYIKPQGAKIEDDVMKDPAAEPIYDEWLRRLDEEQSYSEVADWLEDKGIPVGPYCRSKKWTGRMVRRITFNPILKGLRVRNKKIAKRINKTGKRISVDAPPEELLERNCPHLAFIEPERYDRLIRKLQARNEKYRRGRDKGGDSSGRIGRRWRAWPGHHLLCGVCGNSFYWGGHGQTNRMMCAGARDYQCWNAITFNGPDAAHRLCAAVLAEIESLDGFGTAFIGKVREKAEPLQLASDSQLKQVTRELDKVRQNIERVKRMLLDDAKGSRTLTQALMELEAEEDRLLRERDLLSARSQQPTIEIPSMDELRSQARAVCSNLSDKTEFGKRMRDLIPYLKVLPYRLCDGGGIVLRAKVELNLTSLVPESVRVQELNEVLCRKLTVDLFEPPQRAKFRKEVVSRRKLAASDKVTEAEVAKTLGITITAAQKAMALQRLMDGKGSSDPYVLVGGDSWKNRRAH